MTAFTMCVAMAVERKEPMHRWKVGRAPSEPAYRRRRRRALATERKSRRRERGIGVGLSKLERLERPARTLSVPLGTGPALIAILMLSLGLWAMIWAAVALTLRTLA